MICGRLQVDAIIALNAISIKPGATIAKCFPIRELLIGLHQNLIKN